MTGFIHSRILAVALLAAPAVAVADTPYDDAADRVIARERQDGARVAYYAKMTIIAERDLATATRVIEMARVHRAIALRHRDARAAAYWSRRWEQALADARHARRDAARFSRARDAARADFEASADAVRNLRGPG
jgi:hypothetical protein